MRVAFHKYEGLGNDFIVVDRNALDAASIEMSVDLAKKLCDRHRGIGADGVLIVGEKSGVATLDVINSDGSIPEMCGNGLRCVAWHLMRQAGKVEGSFDVDTRSGLHHCEVENGDGDTALVQVQMAVASFDPKDIGLKDTQSWVEHETSFDGTHAIVTAVSMGNPHAVLFDISHDARQLAPKVQSDARFDHGVNVGIAAMRSGNELDLQVLERGAGWTLACGTGACAAVAAAVSTGRVSAGESVQVNLPGGPLFIRMSPDTRVEMKGEARFVFGGEADFSALTH